MKIRVVRGNCNCLDFNKSQRAAHQPPGTVTVLAVFYCQGTDFTHGLRLRKVRQIIDFITHQTESHMKHPLE